MAVVIDPYISAQGMNLDIGTRKEFNKVRSKFTTEQITAVEDPKMAKAIAAHEDYLKAFTIIIPEGPEGDIVKWAFTEFFKTFDHPNDTKKYGKLVWFEEAFKIFREEYVARIGRSFIIHGKGMSCDYFNPEKNIIFGHKILNPYDYKWKTEDTLLGDIEYKDGYPAKLERQDYAGMLGWGYKTKDKYINYENLVTINYRPTSNVLENPGPVFTSAEFALHGRETLKAYANRIRFIGSSPVVIEYDKYSKDDPEAKEDLAQANNLTKGFTKVIQHGRNKNIRLLVDYSLAQSGDQHEQFSKTALESFGLNNNIHGTEHKAIQQGSLITIGEIEERTTGRYLREIRNYLLMSQLFPRVLYHYVDEESQNKLIKRQREGKPLYIIKEIPIIPPNLADVSNFMYVASSAKGIGIDGKLHSALNIEQIRKVACANLQILEEETPVIETPYKRALPGVPELKEGTIPPTMTTKPNPKVGGIIKPDQIENETQMQNKLLLQILSNNILNQDEYE